MLRVVVSASKCFRLGEKSKIKHELFLDEEFERNGIIALWPQRITMNAVSPGFLMISRLCLGGFEVLRGEVFDAWAFNANAVGISCKAPRIKRESRITVEGVYTGLVPAPLTCEVQFDLVVSLFGPAATSETTAEEIKRLDLE